MIIKNATILVECQTYNSNIYKKYFENLQFLTKIKIKQPSSFFFTVAGA